MQYNGSWLYFADTMLWSFNDGSTFSEANMTVRQSQRLTTFYSMLTNAYSVVVAAGSPTLTYGAVLCFNSHDLSRNTICVNRHVYSCQRSAEELRNGVPFQMDVNKALRVHYLIYAMHMVSPGVVMSFQGDDLPHLNTWNEYTDCIIDYVAIDNGEYEISKSFFRAIHSLRTGAFSALSSDGMSIPVTDYASQVCVVKRWCSYQNHYLIGVFNLSDVYYHTYDIPCVPDLTDGPTLASTLILTNDDPAYYTRKNASYQSIQVPLSLGWNATQCLAPRSFYFYTATAAGTS